MFHAATVQWMQTKENWQYPQYCKCIFAGSNVGFHHRMISSTQKNWAAQDRIKGFWRNLAFQRRPTNRSPPILMISTWMENMKLING
jgi:hypothetical protein